MISKLMLVFSGPQKMENEKIYHLVVFISLVLRIHGSGFQTILQVQKGSGVKVFDLWNLKNVYCGTMGTTPLFRHDYIDYFDHACVEYLSVVFEDNQKMVFKYDSPKSSILKDILQSQPTAVGPNNFLKMGGLFMTNTYNGFEFLVLSTDRTKLYAGIYYNITASNTPLFLYSELGSPALKGDPLKIPGIHTASNVQIGVSLKDNCTLRSANRQQVTCPAKGKPTVQTISVEVRANLGDTVTLHCSYTAYGPVSVEWQFKNSMITAPLDKKYYGATTSYPSLTIYNFQTTDEGIYTCRVTNSEGTGKGRPINLRLAGPSTTMVPFTNMTFVPMTRIPPTIVPSTGGLVIYKAMTSIKQATNDSSTLRSTNVGCNDKLPGCNFTPNTECSSPIFRDICAKYCGCLGISSEYTSSLKPDEASRSVIPTSEQETSSSIPISNQKTNSAITTYHQTSSRMSRTTSLSLLATHDQSRSKTTSNSNTAMCSCSCKWLTPNGTKYTITELRVMLEPKLTILKKELTVNRKNLSTFLNKRRSAPDHRVSSQSLGCFGIAILLSVPLFLLIIDCSSIITCSTKLQGNRNRISSC